MELLTAIAGNAESFLGTLSLDVLTLASLFIIFFILGLRSGTSYCVGLIMSMYVTAVLFIAFPFRDAISFDLGLLFSRYDIIELVSFVIVAGLVNVIMDYALEFDYREGMFGNMFHTVIASVSATLGLLAVLYTTNIATIHASSSSLLDMVFANELYLFGLLVLPLVGVFIIVR